ncbi:MAG: hypothetical protein A3I01_17420 [Betaproteobacteria bacterium RIFCSPLOWO2_02_FULL_65_24]|nr:MAG: hypothetical protein A3I01_17420 [Betaproteobacteria bacterium RIFCSPLOWO2_02_FULL_65_24]OGA88006.1 MAG: hypothetical protein A3G27_13540 [Betaproteobacteria bacterium RIFCSPLOWO2_12_FULL_66_14]
MRFLAWLLRAFLFLVLLLFAFKNTSPVQLRFLFDTAWDVPLVLLLLAFFALGAALGVLACVGRLLRQRREIQSLRREAQLRPDAGTAVIPPQAGI